MVVVFMAAGVLRTKQYIGTTTLGSGHPWIYLFLPESTRVHDICPGSRNQGERCCISAPINVWSSDLLGSNYLPRYLDTEQYQLHTVHDNLTSPPCASSVLF